MKNVGFYYLFYNIWIFLFQKNIKNNLNIIYFYLFILLYNKKIYFGRNYYKIKFFIKLKYNLFINIIIITDSLCIREIY